MAHHPSGSEAFAIPNRRTPEDPGGRKAQVRLTLAQALAPAHEVRAKTRGRLEGSASPHDPARSERGRAGSGAGYQEAARPLKKDTEDTKETKDKEDPLFCLSCPPFLSSPSLHIHPIHSHHDKPNSRECEPSSYAAVERPVYACEHQKEE